MVCLMGHGGVEHAEQLGYEIIDKFLNIIKLFNNKKPCSLGLQL